MAEMQKCRFLPAMLYTAGQFDKPHLRDFYGVAHFQGCVFAAAFGGIPAGEYDRVAIDFADGQATATRRTDDGATPGRMTHMAWHGEFTLVPKG